MKGFFNKMNKFKYKIGYSEYGGIFIGKKIQSDFHKHHLIAIIISFNEPFIIIDDQGIERKFEVALIPKDIAYKLSTNSSDYTAFIHIDPYSEIGIKLSQVICNIKELNRFKFQDVIYKINKWLICSQNSSEEIELILNSIAEILLKNKFNIKKIDDRVLSCIKLIRESDENVKLENIAEQVYLSSSRLSHLFKQEIGVSFQEFVLHSKMVKSLHAIYRENNLSKASIIGGFSDQPHFIKTFKKTFGIKPSEIKNIAE